MVAAAPGRRAPTRPDAPRRAAAAVEALAAGREAPATTLVGTVGTDPLSGTSSYAASRPTDLDSVAHPARGRAGVAPTVVLSPSLPAAASVPPPRTTAVRGAPAADAGPAVSGPTTATAPQPGPAEGPKAPPVAQAPKAPPVVQDSKTPPMAKAPKAPKAPKARKAPKAPAAAPVPEPSAPPVEQPQHAPAPHAQAAEHAANGGKRAHPKGAPPGQAEDGGHGGPDKGHGSSPDEAKAKGSKH